MLYRGFIQPFVIFFCQIERMFSRVTSPPIYQHFFGIMTKYDKSEFENDSRL